MAAPWPRAHYVSGGGSAHVALIALSRTRIGDPLPISRVKHGMPDEGIGASSVALVARDRAEDPEWFADQVIGPFAELIATDLGGSAAEAALAAEHAYVIESEVDDPDDLGHVQAAWALAKCLCEEGAVVIIDVYAARAHLGFDVAQLDPERGFDLMHEITLFFDEQGDGTLAAWTLGLVKFGRPELVVLDLVPDSASAAAVLLRDLAATLADGDRIEPGDTRTATGDVHLVAEAFDPGQAPVVAVEGPALCLRPTALP